MDNNGFYLFAKVMAINLPHTETLGTYFNIHGVLLCI